MPLDAVADDPLTPVEPEVAAAAAGLRYVTDEGRGIGRRRVGKNFTYRLPTGGPVKDPKVLQRIKSLAIPPAYTQVWICPHENGHIQATGRDAKGRKQYRYHPRWREVRDAAKYEHVMGFAALLPTIRARVDADMRRPGLPREKVLATVVHLLETTLIRIGNEEYVEQNDSRGLTTLENRHVAVEGDALRFRFKGKSGKAWNLKVRDRRVAKIVRQCQDLPGQDLFQYVDEAGEPRQVTSSDVNDYLREITGAEVTAKDFRTWAGTVLAALALQEFEKFDSATAAKKNVKAAIDTVAARLGNTPTVCRKCYVHPEVLDTYLAGELALEVKHAAEAELRNALDTLKPEEAAVLALLKARLERVVPAAS